MPRNFTQAMRGAVLRGGKPMSDFVTVLYRNDRLAARREGGPNLEGFRAQHKAARHRLCHPTDPKMPTGLRWLQAGALICNAARTELQRTPDICPETALRQTVHAINKGTITHARVLASLPV